MPWPGVLGRACQLPLPRSDVTKVPRSKTTICGRPKNSWSSASVSSAGRPARPSGSTRRAGETARQVGVSAEGSIYTPPPPCLAKGPSWVPGV
eukprot:7550339-Pyramimonas_sp.AAC.1